ncbi:MAG: Tetratricopeptide 2 repeat protein [Verrucomicrobiales bacterium]|nr:Tetratricopeptide 2 repeat protein [Verrucomicrobiales bacterium]
MNDAAQVVSQSPQGRARWGWRPYALALLLIVLTIVLFWPATKHPFMMIDDSEYVTSHPLVTQGLTRTGLAYAFVARHSGNWHPLTTISHMVDCQLFGLNPVKHHLENILIHALNAALLFLLVRTLTGSLWRSFFVAAFFALHPLRVESVAWVSERKDVLCAFFYLLTLWAYARYAQERSRLANPDSPVGPGESSSKSRFPFYGFSLVFFALALLSKPMAVTLPFVLFLLDYWPLQRFPNSGLKPSRSSRASLYWALLREKIPFIILTLIDSYITTQVQSRAMTELQTLPISMRLANMFLSYSQYISKTFLPDCLAVVYPYRFVTLANVDVIIAIVLLGALSVLAWCSRKRMPWLFVGWLWFLGMLIPVIGLVQVGIQSWADRYTYLPCIGIVFVTVWALASLTGNTSPISNSITSEAAANAVRSPWRGRILAFAGILALAGLSMKTRAQLTHWRSNEELMDHTLRTAGDSELVRHCIGFLALGHGRLEEAARQFRSGLSLDSDAVASMLGLAAVYEAQDKGDRAERLYRKALEIEPSPSVHFQLADFLNGKNRLDEARIHYLQGLGAAPYHVPARIAMGNVYAKQGNLEAARGQFEAALRLNPNLPGAHVGLAGTFSAGGQDDKAVFHLREAMILAPYWVEPVNNLAWRLATNPKPALRNSAEALRLARRAVELTRTNDFEMLDTLAAAQAQNGAFPEAVATARQALDLAIKAGKTNELSGLSNHLVLYEKGLPCCGP